MIQYTLDQNDFLRFQLYTVSKSKRIKTKRIRGWILLVITFLSLAYLFSTNEDRFLTYYFLGAALITAPFYPFYFRWRYKRHYERYVTETFKNRFGIPCELDFQDQYFTIKDTSSDSRVKVSDIERVDEISDNIFIKIKSGESLIVPKNVIGFEEFKISFQRLMQNNRVDWHTEEEWRWK